MIKPRVLVCAPTSDKKHYVKSEWLQKMQQLTYPNYDILVVDNSKDEEYYKKEFLDEGITARHVPPTGNVIEYITASQNVILDYFKEHNYDYMFMCESDVLPPNNVIEYLMHYDKPVVTLPYAINYQESPSICWQMIEDTYAEKQTLLMDDLLTVGKWKGGLQEVFACGIGCTLIHRDVFNYVTRFRADANANEAKKTATVFSDTYFYKDLYEQNIPAYMCQEQGLAIHKWSDWNKNEEFNSIK